MDTVNEIDGQHLTTPFQDLSIQSQNKEVGCAVEEGQQAAAAVGVEHHHHGVCAICLNKIVLQETALVKGFEHAYYVICILRWATYTKEPSCPQCKHPFEFLNVHRSLDGRYTITIYSLVTFMFAENKNGCGGPFTL